MNYLPQRDIDTFSPTGTPFIKQKRTRKPWVYESEYDALKLECDKWKKACKGTAIFAIAYILMDILYGLLS